MFKHFLLLLSLIGIATGAFAQNTIRGKVQDHEGLPLAHATIVLLNPVDSTLKYFGITDKDGAFRINGIRNDSYLLQLSYVGTEMIYENITVPMENEGNIGVRTLKPLALEAIQVVGEYVAVRFKHDTTEFNARAFPTRTGAVVEELLKKLPGIEVDLSGNIKALGTDVVKVLVDGKEFFGKDTKIASKNLPAAAVEKVQVFDKKSDQNEFSGIDDGVRDRTINLELDEKVKVGVFGNIMAGGGHDNLIKEQGDSVRHYQLSGRLYRFTNGIQQALLGMSNNTNEFGLSTGETSRFGDNITGQNITHAAAVNLSWNPGEFNSYGIYYLGNTRKTLFEETKTSLNYINDAVYHSNNLTNSESRITPNALNIKIRHRFEKNPDHYLLLSGGASFTNDAGTAQNLVNNLIASQNISRLESEQNSENNSISGAIEGGYQARFFEGKTQLNISFDANKSNGSDRILIENRMTFFNPEILNGSSQYQESQNDHLGAGIHPKISQQIGRNWHLSGALNIGTDRTELDRELGFISDHSYPVDSLSPVFISSEKYLIPEFSLQWSNSRHRLHIQAQTAWNGLDKILWGTTLGKSVFFTPLCGFYWEHEPRDNRRINVHYNSFTTMPSLNQLIPVTNTLNPFAKNIGNPDLEPSVTHRLSTEASLFDRFSFTSVFARLTGTFTQNAISTSRTINEKLEQTILPVNVPMAATINGSFDFTTPVRLLGIKIHLAAQPGWSQSTHIINGDINEVNTMSNTVKMDIDNRYKDKLDIRAGASLTLSNTRYSIQKEYSNIYSVLQYYGDIRYQMNDHWQFWLRTAVNTYSSRSFDETNTFPLMHASVAYHFLTGGKASIHLEGIDLLDKNNGFKQLNDINYMAHITTNTIGRVVMLSFKYQFNQVGAEKKL